MKIFYRYIRPVKFVENRAELQTLPHGGICLRFEELESGELTFTHARCHDDELFSKEVAKNITIQRSAGRAQGIEYPTVQLSMDALALSNSVIHSCLEWDPRFLNDQAFILKYLKLEFHELAHALEEVLCMNHSERMKSEIWTAGISARNLKEQYSALSDS
jgi:hypothetical protein